MRLRMALLTAMAAMMALGCCGCSQSPPPAGRAADAGREPGGFVTSFDQPMGPLSDWLVLAETHPGQTPAQWEIKADPAAASPPNVLALTQTKNKGSTYNLAIFTKPQFRDLDLTVKVRADTGEEDQGGGPIWRCRDANNYYICRVNPLEANFRVYRVVDGKRTQLATAETDAAAGVWHTIRVTMTGSQIACHLDGRKLLAASDETLPEAGRIGLWTKADAATSFDDLSARDMSGSAPQ